MPHIHHGFWYFEVFSGDSGLISFTSMSVVGRESLTEKNAGPCSHVKKGMCLHRSARCRDLSAIKVRDHALWRARVWVRGTGKVSNVNCP